MWIFALIGIAALALFACEKFIGVCPPPTEYFPGESRPDTNCFSAHQSTREIAFRLLPIFLGGIGIPLTFAHPFPGLFCLILALLLFLFGKK